MNNPIIDCNYIELNSIYLKQRFFQCIFIIHINSLRLVNNYDDIILL